VLLLAGRLADDTNGKLALCGLTSEVQRLFDLGAFTDLFVIYASRDESVSKIG
jgi:anti-anti-sigma regulatory factor